MPPKLQDLDLSALPPDRQLAALLAATGRTWSDLADELGVGKAHLSLVLVGKRTSAPLVARILELTGVDLAP